MRTMTVSPENQGLHVLRRMSSYLLLPREVSRFERDYLASTTRVGLWFFYAHLPVMMIVALLANTSVARAGLYTAVVLLGPTLAFRTFSNPRHITRLYAFTAMVLGGLLVHFGRGPMQIEMHFYFFVLIALLAVFGDPLVIIVAAVTVALHHLIVFLIAPASVFNYEASAWAVAVHALFVILESVAACFVARSFFNNVIGLEKIVSRRTEELATRTERMALVLENVEQGLVIVQPDGTLADDMSEKLHAFLGPQQPGDRLWDWVSRADASAGSWIEVGWSMLVDGFLPLEVAVEQLPKRFTKNGRVHQLAYRPLGTGDSFSGLLFVVTDVTAEAERERYESEQRELLVLFERVLKDRGGIVEFAAEATEIVDAITEEDVSMNVAKRLLHTLKGNALIFGCGSLTRVCHDIETRIADSGQLTMADRVELRVSWDHVREKLSMLVGDSRARRFEIDPKEHEAVLRALRDGSARSRVVEMLEEWTLEPTEIRLKRLADQARNLAVRLGKGTIDVRTHGNGIRLDPEPLRPFWAALLHVLRNAVDHGLESPSERAARGKNTRGAIELATRLQGDRFIVEVTDDGGGIAWDKVRARAIEKGLPTATEQDLEAALFEDGLSTKDVSNAYSGRGVGMSAIASKCRELGGTMRIRSVDGHGTTVTIELPRKSLKARSEEDTQSTRDVHTTSLQGVPSMHEALAQ